MAKDEDGFLLALEALKCRYCGAVLKRLQRHPAHRDGKCAAPGGS